MKIVCNVMEISPSMAREWLKTSEGNPRWKNKIVNPEKVKKIAEDIKNGKWGWSNNSIAFYDDGVLADGHHRLKAIAISGIPVKSIVTFNLPRESVKHIDENAPRTVAQRTGIKSQVVGAVNIHLLMRDKNANGGSSAEIEDFVIRHPLLYDAEKLCHVGCTGSIGRKAGVIHGIFCALEYGVDPEKIEQFMRVVNTGFSDNAFSTPAIVIRNMLIDKNKSSLGTRHRDHISCAIQTAIRDYVAMVPRRSVYKNPKPYYFDKMHDQKREDY